MFQSKSNYLSKEIYQAYLDTDEPTPTLDEVANAMTASVV
jgi:hypothetical protein